MGLAPKNGGEPVVIEIDGDEYTLKSALGWYDMQRVSEVKGVVMHVSMSDARTGRFFAGSDDKMVPITMDGMEDATLSKLGAWLTAWSHVEDGKPVPLTKENIKRLPPRHVARLSREIARLEKETRGPVADSPLASLPNA
jgi:hypothetical protein